MGKHVVDKNYRRFDSVGQSDMCAECSTGCKTSCSRKLAHQMGNDVPYIISNENEKKVIAKRFYEVTIKDVDSIPCDLKEQKILLDEDGNKIQGDFVTPWKMDWLEEVIIDYCKNDSHMSGNKKVELYNPEEEDQLIVCEVNSYIERQ